MIEKLMCKRCGHEWVSVRALEEAGWLPKHCARCNSPYWHRERGNRQQGGQRPDSPIKKYGIDELLLRGAPARIAWPALSDGSRDYPAISGIHRSIGIYQRRTGKKFFVEGTHSFLLIWRIA